MKGRPIEPGCLALVVRTPRTPENAGKVVRVVSRTYAGYLPPGAPPSILGAKNVADGWIVRTPDGRKTLMATTRGIVSGKRVHAWFDYERSFAGRCLIRIDDDELQDDTHTTTEKELTT